MRNELVAGVAKSAGVAPEKTQLALSAALSLMDRHADRDRMRALYAGVPEAKALQVEAPSQPKPTGFMGGMMKALGGAQGAALSDALAMGQTLNAQGVTNGQLKRLLPAAAEWVKARTGQDLLGDAMTSIPGVAAFLAAKGGGEAKA
jgi:hypothetical protein